MWPRRCFVAGTCLFSGWTVPTERGGQTRLAEDFILEWTELSEPNEGVQLVFPAVWSEGVCRAEWD